MSSSGLLERYIGPDRTQDHDKEEKNNSERLPRIWPGFVISGIYLLWSLFLLLTGGSDWADPCPIVGLPIACYWYFCIYKIHKNLRALVHTYPISPLKATTLTIIPSLLAIVLGGVFELTKNPFLTLAVTAGLFCNMLFNVYWQMRWTSTAVKFAKEKASFSKIPNWIPGIILIIGASLGNWVSTPLGALVTFGVGLFLVKMITAVVSAREILCADVVANKVTEATTPAYRIAAYPVKTSEIDTAPSLHVEPDRALEVIPDLSSNFTGQAQNKLLHIVSRNAFRILGLPVSTSQSGVVNSVSTLRRAIKIGKAKETVWDIACLGVLTRTNGEIQNAETRLTDPETRSIERLFWFHSTSEGDLNNLDINHADSICNKWSQSDSTWAKHDVALLRFITASILDPNLNREDLWSTVVASWKAVAENDAYWTLLLQLDEEGQFERLVDSSEVSELRDSSLKRVFDPIATIAKDALIENEIATAKKALNILTDQQLPPEISSWFEQDIAGQLEHELETLCKAFRKDCIAFTKDCHDRAEEENRNKDIDTKTYKAACDKFRERYHSEIETKLAKITTIFGKDSDIARRGRESSAVCLDSLASAYTWADDIKESQLLLKISSQLAQGTLAQSRIEESLASMEEQAAAAKIWKDLKPVKSAPQIATWFGFGVNLYPNWFNLNSDPETKSYLATYYITCLFFPVFPLARYRIIDIEGGTTRFLGHLPMERFDQWHRVIGVIAVLCFIIFNSQQDVAVKKTTTHQNQYQENSTATEQAQNDYRTPDEAQEQQRKLTMSALDNKIELGRDSMKKLELKFNKEKEQISSLRGQLANYKEMLKSDEHLMSQGMDVDRTTYEQVLNSHNSVVRQINSLVKQFNASYNAYDKLFKQDKDLVQQYNALVKQ